jgi:hypothetical protein
MFGGSFGFFGSSAASSDDITYTNAAVMPEDVGGWPSGSSFPDPTTMTDMWDGLLYPYQYPAFTAFALDGYSVFEVGDGITAASHTFTWTTSNSAQVAVNSISVLDITGSATLLSGLANDGSQAYVFPSAVIYLVANSHTYRVSGINTSAGSFTRDLVLYWRWRRWYGTSANTSLTEAQVKALINTGLVTTYAANYAFAAGDYKYIAFLASWGAPASFKDSSTGLDVPMEAPATVSITNDYGVTADYYVYRTTNILGAAITIIVA